VLILKNCVRWAFNDLSHFDKAFRAQFDMTPGEWRNSPAS
jgi:AraC-like DNA-binding protein